jgi:phosphomannomutase
MPTLRSQLNYVPKELQFGTSGRRGLIVDLTQLEIYINVTAEVEYLLSLAPEDGGIRQGDDFYYAADLRPSSPILCEAVECALADSGMRVVNLGQIPTPALMYYALGKGCASIMVTGSHIPFDRNGYKLNTSRGELLKHHEGPIGAKVAEVRERIYSQPFANSVFDETGTLRVRQPLSAAIDSGREAYLARYLDFFGGQPASLTGRRILVYQHSAVGRDLLVDLLTHLGADVIPAGRSDSFVPIDTENIDAAQLETIQKLAAEHGGLWAVVSTDGDSDRPLILSVKHVKQKTIGVNCPECTEGEVVERRSKRGKTFYGCDRYPDCNFVAWARPVSEKCPDCGSPYMLEKYLKAGAFLECPNAECKYKRVNAATGTVKFHAGDLVGMIVAEYLQADAVVVPISCNDAIDRGALADALEPKTKIGSPFVIAGMTTAARKGRRAICGWEANGGFLLGSDIVRNGHKLTTLATRDAFLPVLAVLFAAAEHGSELGTGLADLFAALPKRFSKSGLLKNFPREAGLAIVQRLTPSQQDADDDQHARIATSLARVFTRARCFTSVARLDYTDGVRIIFSNNDVAHIRPSGNADELRIYAAADTQSRADTIVAEGIREPDGILRSLQRM